MAKPLKKLTPEEAKAVLWHRGDLEFKCHPVQKEMRDVFYKSEANTTNVWLLARQSGKSTLLAILSLEICLRKKNSVVKILTDTKIHVQTIFEPIFNELLDDCPDTLKPVFYKKDYKYVFHNGSQIQLAGTDNKHYERLRGQKSSAVFVDEAGFCNELDYVVRSVLLPTTTHTGGKIVLATTPPDEEVHDFYTFVEEAEHNNTLIKKTIDDNPLLSKEQKEKIAAKMGGRHTNQFRREYLVELIRSEHNVVFPEFNEELIKKITQDWPVPPCYDSYVSMDLGFKDLTAVLFGYYDFKKDKIVFQDEILLHGKDFQLPKLLSLIEEKEKELWYHQVTNEVKEPLIRVSDVNPIATNEITKLSHGRIRFSTPKKDDKQAAINYLRVLLAQEKIIINPRCKNLIMHIKNCKWSKNKVEKQFARSEAFGHYDLVDAAIYFVRSVNTKKNPYPADYNLNLRSEDKYTNNPDFGKSDYNQLARIIFNRKK